jgi:uncharacterized phage protein gp47/JayE
VTIIYNDKYDELVSAALDELRASTDITQLTPGAKARSLIEIIMRELGTAYHVFSTDLLQAFVRNASGDNLDMIAELMGERRLRANRNTVPSNMQIQKFYVASGTFGDIHSTDITLPAGTEISTRSLSGEEVTTYVLIEDLVCSSAASEAYASIGALEFGPVSNVGEGTLTVHDFEQYDDYLNNSLKTTNLEAIAYATEEESDNNFRYRIVNKTLESEAANSIAIRMAVLAVPGVADVLLDEYHRGIGTGAAYIKAITPTVSETLLAAVQDVLYGAKAFGSFIEARAPKIIGIEMTVKLNLYNTIRADEKEALRILVRNRIVDYINRLDINEDLDIEDLVRKILALDPNIKSLGVPTRQVDYLYVWKYSAAEDNRIRSEVLPGTNVLATNYERIVVEPTPPPSGGDRITVRI